MLHKAHGDKKTMFEINKTQTQLLRKNQRHNGFLSQFLKPLPMTGLFN